MTNSCGPWPTSTPTALRSSAARSPTASKPAGTWEGSGSRSFYFLDPDGNRLEIFCDGMKVPNGEQFPRAEYADAIRDFMEKQAAKSTAAAAD